MVDRHRNPRRSTDRRSFLRTVGVGAAGLTAFSGVTRAEEPTRDEIMEQSYHILEKTGDSEKRRKYLRNHGFGTATDRHQFSFPQKGPGKQTNLETDDLDIEINLFVDRDGVYTADLTWYYEWGSWGDSGDPPVDIAGVGWDSDWWDYEDYNLEESTHNSGDGVSYRDGTSGSGPAFDVDDYNLFRYGDDGPHYFSVDIVPKGDYESDERRIQGAYSHTWESVDINGVSVGYPSGVSVTVGNSSKEWTTDTEKDGSTLLRLQQRQAMA